MLIATAIFTHLRPNLGHIRNNNIKAAVYGSCSLIIIRLKLGKFYSYGTTHKESNENFHLYVQSFPITEPSYR